MTAFERRLTMNALILVDIQNDFLPGGALPAPNATDKEQEQ